ncbi:MAG: hypothetical protein K2Y29_00955 [Beijerinckiaceae bacterium]|nr:hypothetical protein [Beijerinckiaceae bacterium]
MFKQSIALCTLIAFAMLIAAAVTPHASVVVSTPAGMDMSTMLTEGRTLVSEMWDAF